MHPQVERGAKRLRRRGDPLPAPTKPHTATWCPSSNTTWSVTTTSSLGTAVFCLFVCLFQSNSVYGYYSQKNWFSHFTEMSPRASRFRWVVLACCRATWGLPGRGNGGKEVGESTPEPGRAAPPSRAGRTAKGTGPGSRRGLGRGLAQTVPSSDRSYPSEPSGHVNMKLMTQLLLVLVAGHMTVLILAFRQRATTAAFRCRGFQNQITLKRLGCNS